MTHLVVALGFALVAALGQSMVGPSLALLPGRPDLPLVLVLAWAMLRGSGEGALVGFAAGLALDSVSYTPFGMHGALLGLVGYGTGLGETNFYRGNLPFFLLAGAAATIVYHAAQFLLLQAFGFALPPVARTFTDVALPAAPLNALLLVPTFLLCRHVMRGLTGWRQLRV